MNADQTYHTKLWRNIKINRLKTMYYTIFSPCPKGVFDFIGIYRRPFAVNFS